MLGKKGLTLSTLNVELSLFWSLIFRSDERSKMIMIMTLSNVKKEKIKYFVRKIWNR